MGLLTWCYIPSPITADILSSCSELDGIILDMEHSPMNTETIFSMISIAQKNGKKVWVRLPNIQEDVILKVLDMGCNGIMAPHISNVGQAQRFQDACFYFPNGNRGLSPFTAVHKYTNKSLRTSMRNVNKELLAGILIEDHLGLINLKSILKQTALDVVYLGLYDISISLGKPGDISSPKIMKHIKDALAIINHYGADAGIYCDTWEDVHKYKKMGFRFLAYSCDANRLKLSYQKS